MDLEGRMRERAKSLRWLGNSPKWEIMVDTKLLRDTAELLEEAALTLKAPRSEDLERIAELEDWTS